MTDPTLLTPLTFNHGPALPNRFMLAPLTNQQSGADGVLSDDEQAWLTLRAAGGFGGVMTAAAFVQDTGRGFPGQLGVADDAHLPGLTALASALQARGALAFTQLQHAGSRSTSALIGTTPVAPSDGRHARALTLAEIEGVRDAFIAAAVRSQQAGMDGTELHAAHGYLLSEFLSPELNRRTDDYGGSFDNRRRLLDEIIEGVRTACGEDFILGVRLSPERFGINTGDAIELTQMLVLDDRLDFVDISLWDTFKAAEDLAFAEKSLAAWFGDAARDGVRVGFAGKLYDPQGAERALDLGADFVLLGRGAILMHDFPHRYAADRQFAPLRPPMDAARLAAEGISSTFAAYLRNWEGFIAD